jgi:hypothetical protein
MISELLIYWVNAYETLLLLLFLFASYSLNMDSGKPYGGILIGSNKNKLTKHQIDNSLIECLLGG